MEDTVVSNPIAEQLLTEVRDLLAHPAMTTSFADYNVIEALLLLLFFGAYLWACYAVVKGVISWPS